jgi:hypothetical protein
MFMISSPQKHLRRNSANLSRLAEQSSSGRLDQCTLWFDRSNSPLISNQLVLTWDKKKDIYAVVRALIGTSGVTVTDTMWGRWAWIVSPGFTIAMIWID